MTNTAPTESQTETRFSALGSSGKSRWWRYLLGSLIILGGYAALANIVYIIVLMVASGGQVSRIDPATGHIKGVDPIVNYIALNIGFWFIILFSVLVVRFLHKRPFLSLINPRLKFDFRRLGIGCGLWFCLVSIQALGGALLFPHDYSFALQTPEFFYYAPVVLFFTPIQCLSEELLFRGYLLQSQGTFIKSQWWLCGINGVLFAAPHYFNPEVAGNPIALMLCYFAIGFFLALATVRGNSLEFAIGAHIGNNLFDGLVVNYKDSVLETKSIFLCTQTHPWYEFVTLVIFGAVFITMIDRYVRAKTKSSATV